MLGIYTGATAKKRAGALGRKREPERRRRKAAWRDARLGPNRRRHLVQSRSYPAVACASSDSLSDSPSVSLCVSANVGANVSTIVSGLSAEAAAQWENRKTRQTRTAKSTMNIEQARFNMIEQQIRPWEVLDQDVLNLLSIVKRENFVPAAYRDLAFADFEVPLPAGQHMLAPRVEARTLQELAVKKHESVLEIGAGSGYMAALLAHRAQHVLTVEIEPELAQLAKNNLIANGVLNAEVATGDAARGWAAAAPYDVICVSGGLPVLPQEILEHLKIGGRLAAFVGTAPVMKAQIITRIDEKQYRIADVFETYVEPLVNAVQPPRFKF